MKLNNLKEIYKSKGYTQKSLSEEIGITRTNLNRIIKGHSKPSVQTALKLSKLLSISVEEVLELQETSIEN